jgi:hypothetical protein
LERVVVQKVVIYDKRGEKQPKKLPLTEYARDKEWFATATLFDNNTSSVALLPKLAVPE